MPRFFRALNLFHQGAPANPPAGNSALYMSNETVPRPTLRSSDGITRALPYEFFYNVRDYGAVGNGSVNDAPAIQSALDQASSTTPGGVLYIPAGTYRIDAELEIKGSVHILCAPGAVIKRGSSSMQYMIRNFNSTYAPTLYNGRGGIRIDGGVWDADGANLSAACTVIIAAHADGVEIQNIVVRNVPDWHAIEVNACRRVRIRDCTFEGFRVVTTDRAFSEAIQTDLASSTGGLPGIGLGALDNTPCYDVLVTGCTVRSLAPLGSYGCLVGSHTAVNTFEQENIRVIGNLAENLNDVGVRAYNWNNVVISDNTFLACNGGVLVEIPTGCTTDIERFTINGNQFIDSGIQNNGTAVLTNLIETRVSGSGVVRSVTVSNNQIKNFANINAIRFDTSSDVVCGNNSVRNGTHASSVAFRVNNSAFATYVGNKVDGVQDFVMILESVSTDITVTGNVFNSSGGGIFNTGSWRNVFTGNMIRAGGASKPGIQLATGSTEIVVVGNIIRATSNPTNAGIDLDVAVTGIVQGNLIKGWGTTEGATGPINRGGALTPSIATTTGTTNLNGYVT